MTNRTLETRLRKVEAQRQPTVPMQGTIIIAGTLDEVERIRAEHEAAGTHRPGWPIVMLTSRGFQGDPLSS